MKNLTLMSILILFVSCNNDDNLQSTFLDVTTIINFQSESGANLLNTPNYNSNNFKIYYKEGIEFIDQNNGNNDFPKNFFINTETNPIKMHLFLNHSETEQNPITVIQWNETESDTLKASFNRGIGNDDSYAVCNKLWLNGEVIWELENNPTREITIIK